MSLTRRNAVAKLGAAFALMVAPFASVDLVTPLPILAGLALAIPFSGVPFGALSRRCLPPLAAVAVVALMNAALAADSTDGWRAGLAVGLRLTAIVLAGALFAMTTEPADLAGGLQQQVGLSPRLAVGAVAALRLAPLLAADWRAVRLARRARGLAGGWSPAAWLRLVGSALFGLLASAVRRATRLALAMDARGFGSLPCRSAARPQQMRAADWALLGGAVGLAVGSVVLSLASGSWRPLIG